MPLFLQLVGKHAVVGPNLFTLLFWQLMLAYAGIAAADARGYLCRPERMRQKLTSIRNKLSAQRFYVSKQDNTPVQKGC